jgi:hypothetical protein
LDDFVLAPNHDDGAQRSFAATTDHTFMKERFLGALAADITAAGGKASAHRRESLIRLDVALPDEPSRAGLHWSRQTTSPDTFARAKGIGDGCGDVIADGDGSVVDVDAIRPLVEICRTRTQHDVFRYCKLYQSVASSPRPGRRIRLLVKDSGQRRQAIIGAIELASPVWAVAARDRYLGWSTVAGESRISGLRRTMDLATCVAIPPYSHLRGGKLLAALACSSAACNEFRQRYGEPLVAIFATCATGLHYPHVNRIRVRSRNMYRRIGETSGYSAAPFGAETIACARALVHAGKPAHGFHGEYLQLLWVLRSALRVCGIPEEPVLRMGRAKGIYLGSVVPNSAALLRSGDDLMDQPVSSDETVAWWKTRVLTASLAREDLVRAARHAPLRVLR